MPMTAKEEILKCLPHGHTTFNVAWYGAARGEERTEYQGTYGHAVCVRQVGQHWYLIDSENGGPERLTGRGWAQLRGHMRLLAAYDSRDAEGHITGRYVRGMPPLPQWVKPEEVYRVPQCPAARACSVPPEMQPASPCPAVNAAPQDTSTQRQQDSAHLEVLEMPPLLTEQPGQPSPRPPTHVSPPMPQRRATGASPAPRAPIPAPRAPVPAPEIYQKFLDNTMRKEGVSERQAMYRLALTFKESDDCCDALIAEIERGCNTTADLAAQIGKFSSKLREALTIALTNRYTAAPPPEHVLAKDDKFEIKLSTLNVRGLRSGSQELARHLASAAPFLCVVTETKLHTWEHKEAFVSQSCHGYERYLSSYKQTSASGDALPGAGHYRHWFRSLDRSFPGGDQLPIHRPVQHVAGDAAVPAAAIADDPATDSSRETVGLAAGGSHHE